MTLRKKIYFILALPIILFGLVLLLYTWAAGFFAAKEKNHQLAQQLTAEILNLNFVADRYFIYRQQGIYDYWLVRQKMLDDFLATVKGENRQEEVLLREIRSNNNKNRNLFLLLMTTRNTQDRALEERLLEAILLKSRMMYSDSVRIEKNSAGRLEQVRQSVILYSIVTAMLITIAFTVGAVHLTRKVIRNIDRLREGTEKIAAGDLDVQVEVHTGDELGALAQSFNFMTDRLKKSLLYMETSIKALEIENKMTRRAEEAAIKESEDRLRAEESLKKLNAELEERVRERTEEVRKSNSLLAKMKEHADREAYQARIAAERHREQHQKLQRLIAATGRIFASNSVDESLQAIAAIAREITGSRYCVIGHRFKGDMFDIIGSAKADSDPPCLPPGHYPHRGGVYEELLERQEQIVLTDRELKTHPLWNGLPTGHRTVRGLIGVPVIGAHKEILGMLMATDKTDGSEYTVEDGNILAQLAIIAAMAVECITLKGKCGDPP